MARQKINNSDVYEKINSQILAALDKGVVAWRAQWKPASDGRFPHNASTRRNYHGSNVWLLGLSRLLQGYQSNGWLTYNQCKSLKGNVKRGEHGTPITFWRFIIKNKVNPETGETEINNMPLLRYFTVFNLDQCENLKMPEKDVEIKPEFSPIESCENVVSGYPSPPTIAQGFNECSYSPSRDIVSMPFPDQFVSPDMYYESLFHELTHSTGHPCRLDRFTSNEAEYNAGREAHSYEELVAEMGSSYLMGYTGAALNVSNSAAYIKHWRDKITEDPRLIVRASSHAQKAVDHILNEVSE